MSGVIPPGARLDEKGLAARFGVSRTPVREALQQIAVSGLITWKPRQGAVVAELTLHQLIHMFEVMAALEGLCGRLAARRMTASERAELEQLHQEMGNHVKAGDTELYHGMNMPFHDAIYRGSHNPFLRQQALTLHKRLAPYRAFQLHKPGRLTGSYDEHACLVRHIVQGAEDEAARHLAAHVELQGEVLGDLVSALTQGEVAEAG